ncbi:MAG: VanZ family protein [Desulfobulbaceae bacterium]|nr:VanZ family protein [Desulfobulbaceae bacterium]
MKISWFTACYAAYIIISASFMRPVLNFIRAHLSGSGLFVFVWLIFGAVFLPILYLIKKQLIERKKYLRLALLILFIGLGLGYALTIPVAEERFHLVLFGLLGFSAAHDNIKSKPWLQCLIAALFCVSVAGLDELFQYFLPDRVGDPRDVLFGAVGGIWGLLIYLVLGSGDAALSPTAVDKS